ncbi:endonuclease/exonuclease/phosphatase family protein [Noviherbaspirillum sedimenti]|uniref:Endonuclease/exonuclease/phosphatase family protein n=1 Tax=Noviherbaspirillum sedimenti TaxID=2320865 RepID=A0A3A3G0V6_9BURK|nr:endonuclease/exonuclease/phosphatase family protein [Noviherbaspirillum sedimenti]RJG02098.1 endonuclease/exonuclease/phosphatase family protein [Noviherbaspirillum sedimenti]
MQQEIRFATFNVCNLAPPGMTFYDNLPPYTPEEYEAKLNWLAHKIDEIDADVIGFQEIFSQSCLRTVLARTRDYREALHAGFDPDPAIEPLTPSVALVSRLPFAAAPAAFHELPPALLARLARLDSPLRRFTRPLLYVPVRIAPHLTVNVLVVHLKSKRPDYLDGEDVTDPALSDLASLRSLYRRGTEAVGLRHVLDGLMPADGHAPLVVMGDFNDIAEAVTTQMVTGAGRPLPQAADMDGFSRRLFDSYRIQTRRDFSRDVGYSHMHEGVFNTLDHVLVSKEFHPDWPDAVGAVMEVLYLNDHVQLSLPQASDHGAVLVRLALHDATLPAAAPASLPLP